MFHDDAHPSFHVYDTAEKVGRISSARPSLAEMRAAERSWTWARISLSDHLDYLARAVRMTNEAAQTVTELRAHLGKSEEKSAPAYIAADASHADALAAVERLLALPTVGLDATGATVHGQGGRPSADIAMSNGAVLTVDSVEENEARHVGPPGRVGTRRTPVVGRPGMLALASCLRRAGEHVQTVTEEAMARDLGVDYLRRAVALAVDMIDTGERWRGFRQLDDWNPWTEARAKGSPLIDVQVVQWDDGTGARFVRTG